MPPSDPHAHIAVDAQLIAAQTAAVLPLKMHSLTAGCPGHQQPWKRWTHTFPRVPSSLQGTPPLRGLQSASKRNQLRPSPLASSRHPRPPDPGPQMPQGRNSPGRSPPEGPVPPPLLVTLPDRQQKPRGVASPQASSPGRPRVSPRTTIRRRRKVSIQTASHLRGS